MLGFEVVSDSEHGFALLAWGCRGDRLGYLEGTQRALACYAAVCVEAAVVGPLVVRRTRLRMALCHGVVPGVCCAAAGRSLAM